MKNIIPYFLAVAIIMCLAAKNSAQTKMMRLSHSEAASFNEQKTTLADSLSKASFKVHGNCGMCSSRIKKALKKDGIADAKWDSETQMAEVTYDASKVTLDKIHEYIAEAGHDTDKMKAPDKVYNKLPGCCQYERSDPEKK